MRFGKQKSFVARMSVLCILSFVLLVQPTFAKPLPSSVGAANYYEMKPSPYYVSLGVKGYQQTTDYTCGPAAVMSLHGHPETRGRLSALLVAEAERLADLAFQDLEER